MYSESKKLEAIEAKVLACEGHPKVAVEVIEALRAYVDWAMSVEKALGELDMLGETFETKPEEVN